MKIGIFDSGIGGLNICAKLIKAYPYFEYLYYADNKHMPYGDKDKATLKPLILQAMDYFLINGADAAIIACNTVSCMFKGELESEYPFEIFYIAPDVEKASKYHNQIAILATDNTANSDFFKKLLLNYNFEYLMPDCSRLAKLTENFAPNFMKNYGYVAKILDELEHNFGVVLGCTHYTFYREYIESLGYACYDETDQIMRKIEAFTKKKVIDKTVQDIDIVVYLTDKTDKARYLCILQKLLK